MKHRKAPWFLFLLFASARAQADEGTEKIDENITQKRFGVFHTERDAFASQFGGDATTRVLKMGSKRSHKHFHFSMNYHPRHYTRRPPRHLPPPRLPYADRPRRKGHMSWKQATTPLPESNIFGAMKTSASRTDNYINQRQRTRPQVLPTLWPRIPASDATPVPPTTLSPPSDTSPPLATIQPTMSWLNLPAAPVVVPQCIGPTAAMWGPVPHVVTFDGLSFDVAGGAQGEFVLVDSTAWTLSAQLIRSIEAPIVSLIKGIGLQLSDGSNLELALARRVISANTGMWGYSCAIDGWYNNQVLDLKTFDNIPAILSRTPQTLEIRLSDGLSATVQPIESGTMGCYMNIFVCMDTPLTQDVSGLLGTTPNGTPSDDWSTSDGNPVTLPEDLKGAPAHDYATTQWCEDFNSLLVNPESPSNSAACTSLPYEGRVDPNIAPPSIRQYCTQQTTENQAWVQACLANGVVGDREEAQHATWVLEQLDQVDSRPVSTTYPSTMSPTRLIPDTPSPAAIHTTSLPTASRTDSPTDAPFSAEATPVPTETTTMTASSTTGPTILPPLPLTTFQPTESLSTFSPSALKTPVPTAARPDITYGFQPDCSVNDPSRFNICLDIASESGEVEEWFRFVVQAKQRWERIIASDPWGPWPSSSYTTLPLEDVATQRPSDSLDDIYISVIVKEIDGKGKRFAEAAPTRLLAGPKILAGTISIDPDDIQDVLDNGIFYELMLHEFGHVLGLGTVSATLCLIDPDFAVFEE